MDNTTNQILVIQPVLKEELDQAHNLLHNFVSWHLAHHTDDSELINECFDKKSFEKELSELPGKYVYPDGSLLLAYYANSPAGCVALKRIDATSCEMKRMFVYQKFHRYGIGKSLAKSIIDEAKKLGYKNIKLDTSIRQIEAQKLYQKYGFKMIEPYYELPQQLKNWLVFMELEL